MVTWDLSQIITKVRNITGTPSTTQLTNDQIADYINTYYVYTMPFELKEQVNLQPINFTTVAYNDSYPLDANYQTDEPMAYANGFPLVFYQDRDIFYQDWPQQYTQDQIGSGDGTVGPYTGTTQAFPIIPGSYFITDGSQVITDVPSDPFDGTGTFTGNGSGTINYTTGVFSASFTNAVATTLTIYDNYQAYQPARPQGVLLYNSKLTFRPVPDQVYAITLQGFIAQQPFTTDTSVPVYTEWGQLIAYGAALEIFSDRGDLGSYNANYPILQRYENVALGRYVEQFTNAQSVPRF